MPRKTNFGLAAPIRESSFPSSSKKGAAKSSTSSSGTQAPTSSSSSPHYYHQYSTANKVLAKLEEQFITIGGQTIRSDLSSSKQPPPTPPTPQPQPQPQGEVKLKKKYKTEDRGGYLLDSPYKIVCGDYAERRSSSSTSISPSPLQLLRESHLLAGLHNHIPSYLQLRDLYKKELQISMEVILSYPDEMDRMKEKRKFFLGILAMRQLSVKMMETYLTVSESSDRSWEEDSEYLSHLMNLPSSLDFIDCPPFTTYTGIFLSCNPFASTHDLFGELSISSDFPQEVFNPTKYHESVVRMLPLELRFSETEFNHFQTLSAALRKLCEEQSLKGRDIFGSSNVASDEKASKKHTLAFLLFRPKEQENLAKCEEDVAVLRRVGIQRHYLLHWKKKYQAMLQVHDLRRRTEIKLLRETISAESLAQMEGCSAMVSWAILFVSVKYHHDSLLLNLPGGMGSTTLSRNAEHLKPAIKKSTDRSFPIFSGDSGSHDWQTTSRNVLMIESLIIRSSWRKWRIVYLKKKAVHCMLSSLESYQIRQAWRKWAAIAIEQESSTTSQSVTLKPRPSTATLSGAVMLAQSLVSQWLPTFRSHAKLYPMDQASDQDSSSFYSDIQSYAFVS
eukprot:scaffold453_cov187-Ochromonas_danica.AAC.17